MYAETPRIESLYVRSLPSTQDYDAIELDQCQIPRVVIYRLSKEGTKVVQWHPQRHQIGSCHFCAPRYQGLRAQKPAALKQGKLVTVQEPPEWICPVGSRYAGNNASTAKYSCKTPAGSKVYTGPLDFLKAGSNG